MDTIVHGTTAYVEIDKQKKIAKKYTKILDLYWIKEWIILKNISHTHIIFPQKYAKEIIDKNTYAVTTMPLYETINHHYTIKQIIQITYDILSALHHCHKNKIIHRDVKPNNIMITNHNSPRGILIDFSHSVKLNLSKIHNLEKNIQEYHYRAPEVYLYQSKILTTYNEKVDIWSLGIVLYCLLTREKISSIIPGDEKTYRKLFISDEKKYLSILRAKFYSKNIKSKINAQLWTLIAKMLIQNPIHRPSAKYLLKNFANIFGEIGIKPNIGSTPAQSPPLNPSSLLLHNSPSPARSVDLSFSHLFKSPSEFKTIQTLLPVIMASSNESEEDARSSPPQEEIKLPPLAAKINAPQQKYSALIGRIYPIIVEYIEKRNLIISDDVLYILCYLIDDGFIDETNYIEYCLSVTTCLNFAIFDEYDNFADIMKMYPLADEKKITTCCWEFVEKYADTCILEYDDIIHMYKSK
jgi:serine/threonine protein kinase